jgi:hypothetical protein
MVARFSRDHKALQAIIADAREVVERGGPDGRAELITQRLAFARKFRRHQSEELAYLVAHYDRDVLAEYQRDLSTLLTDYSAHVNHWNPQRIGEDYPGYVRATTALWMRLQQRFEWEEQVFFPSLTFVHAA